MTMSAVDFLDQWFETDVLKATMSASGIIGTFLGVRSPGTAYVLLHHYMGEIDGAFRSWGFARGGTGAISERDRGRGARGRRRDPTDSAGRAHSRHGNRRDGVVLRTATRFARASSRPASTLGSRSCDSSSRASCPTSSSKTCTAIKFRGSSGKVNLALDALPDFTCLPGAGRHLRGAISISPSVEYMERAYDDAKNT